MPTAIIVLPAAWKSTTGMWSRSDRRYAGSNRVVPFSCNFRTVYSISTDDDASPSCPCRRVVPGHTSADGMPVPLAQSRTTVQHGAPEVSYPGGIGRCHQPPGRQDQDHAG